MKSKSRSVESYGDEPDCHQDPKKSIPWCAVHKAKLDERAGRLFPEPEFYYWYCCGGNQTVRVPTVADLSAVTKPGYHLAEIPRGEYGEVSKIVEEAIELQDAVAQGVRVMELVELSDLIGAIQGHLEKHWPDLSLTDLIKMSEVTRRVFVNKHRIPR